MFFAAATEDTLNDGNSSLSLFNDSLDSGSPKKPSEVISNMHARSSQCYLLIKNNISCPPKTTAGRVVNTVEPPIVDPLNKGYDRKNLSIKNATKGPKCSLSYSTTNTFLTSEERTTSLLTKDKMAGLMFHYAIVCH